VPPPLRNGSPTRPELAEKVQAILDSRKLTLYQVSRRSAELYGRSSPCFLPHNLYYDLRTGAFRPSIHQTMALSRISGYRVSDWLRVFGFNLEDITRLQVLLPSKRTVVLDTSLTDPDEWMSWLDNRPDGTSVPPIAPLAKLLKVVPARRIGSLQGPGSRRFLYAKVGREDVLAFPDLVPGSIVRVNPDIGNGIPGYSSIISERIFLVEHSKGFFCCRVRTLANGAIVPFDLRLRHAQVELQCPREAKLWGTVDFEFRPLLRSEEPEVPKDLARRWKPKSLSSDESFGQLLKRTRTVRNLTVREAAEISRTVAEALDDERYMTSASSLSDYELHDAAPRDFHKIITLCSIYGLQYEAVMRRLGVDTRAAGAESMPDRYLCRASSALPAESTSACDVRTGFLEKLMAACEEIPFFLRHSLEYFSGPAHVSLDDFFWVGGDHDPLHPYLEKGVVVMVNRRRKTPIHFVSKDLWQQPIYVVLKRDGTYLAACCGLEDGALIIHSYTRDFRRNEEYRLHQDADIIGQIVAIARRLT
jgi:transcriptional regulator with XRE-family HTH domain